MAEQNTPFDSAQNLGHEKLKIKSKIILKRVRNNQKDNFEGAMA